VKSIRTVSLLLLFGAVALLWYGRVPGLSNDFCDPDLAGITYGATDLLNGGTIYGNCVETKPPGAYLIFAACYALFGRTLVPIYVLAALLHTACLLLLALMARRTAGPVAALFTAWFYAALAIDAAAAANCPNYDSWMSFFVVFGLAALTPNAAHPTRGRPLLAGVLLGAAFLMKQQAAVFMIVAGLWVVLQGKGQGKRIALHLGRLALGIVLPLAAVLLAWWLLGGLTTLARDLHPLRLRHYVGAVEYGEVLRMARERIGDYLGGTWLQWALVLGGLIWWLSGRDKERLYTRRLLYLLAAVVAVMAGTRYYSHYFIILAAPLALAAGHAAGLAVRSLRRRWLRVALPIILGLSLLWTVRMELLQATMAATGPDLITEEMLTRFTRDDVNLDGRFDDDDLQHLGGYLGSQSGPGETIYVWPYYPQLYFWADRRSPTKHYMYFEVAANLPFKRGGWHAQVNQSVRRSRRQLLADLEAHPPIFIVLPRDPEAWDRPFAELEQWVHERYRPDPKAPGDRFLVYRLPRGGPPATLTGSE